MFFRPARFRRCKMVNTVRPNDTLGCKVLVESTRLSKSRRYGIVKIFVQIFNQANEVVASMKAIWMLSVRPIALNQE
tara:strand:- start:461 stop:691 length:231 start_codon:yes stop_codon:yes gene_type:complete